MEFIPEPRIVGTTSTNFGLCKQTKRSTSSTGNLPLYYNNLRGKRIIYITTNYMNKTRYQRDLFHR